MDEEPINKENPGVPGLIKDFLKSEDFKINQKAFNQWHVLPKDIEKRLTSIPDEESNVLRQKIQTRNFLGSSNCGLTLHNFFKFQTKDYFTGSNGLSPKTNKSINAYVNFVRDSKDRDYKNEFGNDDEAIKSAIKGDDLHRKNLHDEASSMVAQELIDQGVLPTISQQELQKLYGDDEKPTPPLGIGRTIVTLILAKKLRLER